MKSYKFLNKQLAKSMSIISLVGIVSYAFLILNTHNSLNRSLVLSLATMIYSIVVVVLIKQINKQFSEIIFEDEKIKFFFFNQMKSPLILSKNEVRIDLSNEKIGFTNLITNKYIGNAYKNRIAEPEKWDDLIESINHLK